MSDGHTEAQKMSDRARADEYGREYMKARDEIINLTKIIMKKDEALRRLLSDDGFTDGSPDPVSIAYDNMLIESAEIRAREALALTPDNFNDYALVNKKIWKELIADTELAIEILNGNENPIDWRNGGCELLRKLSANLEESDKIRIEYFKLIEILEKCVAAFKHWDGENVGSGHYWQLKEAYNKGVELLKKINGE